MSGQTLASHNSAADLAGV